MPSTFNNLTYVVDFKGSAGIFVGHPLDTVKVRLQTSSYTTLWSCIRQIYSTNGFSGFFRGMSFPLVSSGVTNCVFFGVYGQACHWLGQKPGDHAHRTCRLTSTDYWIFFSAGCFASIVQLVVIVPVDVVKVQMQAKLDIKSKRHGSVVLFRDLMRSGGFCACYRGLLIQAIRDIPSSGVYVLLYESLLEAMVSRPAFHNDYSMEILLAGGTAGSVSWFLIAPLDVLKSRIQVDSQRNYRGIIDCARKTALEGGHRIFFRGVGPLVIRSFPTNAITFLFYSWTLEICRNNQTLMK